MRGDREHCLSAGMDGYLTKPIRADDVYRTLEEFTSVKVPHGTVNATEPTVVTADRLLGPINQHALDKLRALETRGAGTFLREIIQAYLKSAPERFLALRKAAEAGDAKELERCAHSYRGMSATLGADRVAVLCQSVETLAATGYVDKTAPLLDSLAQEFVLVLAALESEVAGTAETPAEAMPS